VSETIDDLAGARGTSSDDPSGRAAAQAAYDAGAVEPLLEQPVFSVWLEFRVHGPEREANELANAIAATLLDHPLVEQPVATTVTRRVVEL